MDIHMICYISIIIHCVCIISINCIIVLTLLLLVTNRKYKFEHSTYFTTYDTDIITCNNTKGTFLQNLEEMLSNLLSVLTT